MNYPINRRQRRLQNARFSHPGKDQEEACLTRSSIQDPNMDIIYSLLTRSREAVCFIDLMTSEFRMNEKLGGLLPGLSSENIPDFPSFASYCHRAFSESEVSCQYLNALWDAMLHDRHNGEPVDPLELQLGKRTLMLSPFLTDNPDGLFIVFQDKTEEIDMRHRRDSFMAELSHELRTPLTSIKGYTELLLMKEHDIDRQRHMLAQIQKEAERLERLVDSFLDYERINSLQTPLQHRVIGMDRFLQDIVASFSSVVSVHDLKVCLASCDIELRADQEKMRHCIQNLVHNAIKYSPDGGSITIEVLKENDHTIIAVHDQGIGIPDEALPKIFDSYYRVDSDSHRQIKGTGLGLQICKRYVEEHGGTIRVESRIGEGSSFFVSIPDTYENTPPL